jgi:hypothetical protein
MSNSTEEVAILTNTRTFEECYPEIEAIIEKKRGSWTYKADLMMDFDDVKMQIIAHINAQWPKYDQARHLGGWVSTIFKRKFINLLRDLYMSTSSPCNRCACNLGNSICSMYGEQGVECPLYAKWSKSKRHSHEVRMPLPLENHIQEVCAIPQESLDLDRAAEGLHAKIKEKLTQSEWEVYRRLYIEGQDEAKIAEELGFKTTESGRKRGYKRILQVKALAYKHGSEILKNDGIEGLY